VASGTLSVLLGNGNGTFQNQTTLSLGGVPLAVAAGDLNADNKPDLAVATSAGNVCVLLGNGADNIVGPVYVVDHAAPSVISINRTNPAGSGANGASVTYTVTFSEAVTGVDASDFALALTGNVTTTPPVVSGSGAVYTVTVNGLAGNGTLGLNLVDD